MNGVYTPARPISGTVLVNIGDLMQRWTADKLISTVSKNSFTKIRFPCKYCRLLTEF